MKKWLVLFFGVLCVSCSAIFVRKANVDGLVSAFYRVAFAFALAAPIYWTRAARRKGKRALKPRNIAICMVGGLFFGLDLAFWNVSVMRSNATIPTLLVNLSSVWVGIGAGLLLKEKAGPAHWVGTAIALLGVAVVVGLGQVIRLKPETGVTYAIIASLFLASYLLVTKRARMEMDTLSVLFYSLLSSSILLLAICLIARRPLAGYSGETWLYLACIGVIVQVGGYFSSNYALGYLPSATVSLASLLQPVLTGVVAVLALGEQFSAQRIVGGLVVLAGICVSLQKPGKQDSAQARTPRA